MFFGVPQVRQSRGLFAFLLLAGISFGQSESVGGTWTPLTNQPGFAASHVLLLTDGTVISQEYPTGNWNRLTPDQHGSYINGTWEQIASLPAGYEPLYYASAVLADGRVVISGGEYNYAGTPDTNLGAVYDPKINVWSNLPPPTGWANIGDATSVVLPDGQWMLANAFDSESAALDPETLQWTLLGSNGKADSNNEEGWTLLPDGTVLAVDVGDIPNSERYFPKTDRWMSAGSTAVPLSDHSSYEIGPAILRPDGTVFATGVCPAVNASCVSPAHTSIYTPPKHVNGLGTWSPGPDFPDGLDISDGPASILPDGNVLMMASPGIYGHGSVFFEFDGSQLVQVASTPNAPNDPSYYGNMLVLPTGQVLLNRFQR